MLYFYRFGRMIVIALLLATFFSTLQSTAANAAAMTFQYTDASNTKIKVSGGPFDTYGKAPSADRPAPLKKTFTLDNGASNGSTKIYRSHSSNSISNYPYECIVAINISNNKASISRVECNNVPDEAKIKSALENIGTVPVNISSEEFLANERAEDKRLLRNSLTPVINDRCGSIPTQGGQRAECEEGIRNRFNTCFDGYVNNNSSFVYPNYDEEAIASCMAQGNNALRGSYRAALLTVRDQVRATSDQNLETIEEGGPGANEEEESGTTCAVTGTGWIVCSVSRTIAEMMSGIWGLLVAFLEVPPLSTDVNSSANFTYRIWEVMRNVANIAFVVAFLVIIFAQLTGAGVSNYGVKKLLPRLIISAILVNISYWLCAVLVDLSNIAGVGIHNLIKAVTDSAGAVEVSTSIWEDVIGALLAGGTLAFTGSTIVAVAAAGTAGATVGALLWAALPALLTVLLIAIICFAILAARQGLLIILIILSPLAFVAFLLPNTENLFNIWRKSLTTMLVFFPIFAIIFAGSQLAGLAIIASTGTIEAGDQSPRAALLILGLFVQVAPLAITPLLIKFSGGLIGQLAGIVNNRGKGFIDRSRNVAERKRKLAIGETLSSRTALKNRFSRGTAGVLRRGYSWINNSNARDADRQKVVDASNQLEYSQTQKAADLSAQMHNLNLNLDTVKAERAVIEKGQEDGDLSYRLQVAKSEEKLLDAKEAEEYRESLSATQPLRSGTETANIRAREVEGELNITRDRVAGADSVLQQEYAEQLRNPATGLATAAGGIDPFGSQRVVARATQTVNEAHAKAVAAEGILLKQAKSSPTSLVSNIQSNTSINGSPATQEQTEAMIQYVARSGTAGDIMKLTDVLSQPQFSSSNPNLTPEVRERNSDLQQVFGEVVGASGKVKSIGGSDYGKLAQGVQIEGYTNHILKTAASKKFKPETFAGMDIDEITAIRDLFAKANPAHASYDPTVQAAMSVAGIGAVERDSLKKAIQERMEDERLKGSLNDRDKNALIEIQSNL